MTSLFEGKTVLVTGGAGGIGRAAGEAFGAAGARVIVADIDEVKAAEVAAATVKGSIGICLDAGGIADISKTIESVATRVGRIDILINNAAAFDMAPILEVTPESFESLFRVNVEGMFLSCRLWQVGWPPTAKAASSLTWRPRPAGRESPHQASTPQRKRR